MAHASPIRRKMNNNSESHNCEDEIPRALDGGFGWIVVIASFFIHFIASGITHSLGIFYVEWMDEFREGTGYTSWILSLMTGMTLCTGPISSALVNKYGCRVVIIAGSILTALCFLSVVWAKNVLELIIMIGFGVGIGLGLIYLPVIVCVSMYFERYRSLAIGIALSGSGFGTFFFAPLVAYLNQKYRWRCTLFVLSGVTMICAIFGYLFRPLQSSRKNRTLSKPCCRNVSLSLGLLKEPVFVLFAVSDFLINISYDVPYLSLNDHAGMVGVPVQDSALLLTIIFNVNTLSRVIWGFIFVKPCMNRLWIYNISLIVSGIVIRQCWRILKLLTLIIDHHLLINVLMMRATIASVFCLNFETFAVYSAVFGFLIAAFDALRSVILVDLLGLEKFNNAFGLLMLFQGIASFIFGAPIVGLLFDLFNSYTPGFMLAGTMIALSGSMLFFIPLLQKSRSHNAPELEMM